MILRPAILVPSALCISLCIPLAGLAAETPSAEKLAEMIDNAKVLEPGYKVSVSVSGSEAIVSTYRNKQSQRDDNDCKIDAALIAKELMISNDFGIRRVKIQFHEQSRTGNMREVNVSFAELKAYATGVVNKDEFIASLVIDAKPEPSTKSQSSQESADKKTDEKAGGTNSAATSDNKESESKTNGNESTEEKKTTTPKIASATPPRKEKYANQQHKIAIEVPAKWKAVTGFGNLVFKLHSDATNQDNISLSRQTSGSPLGAALLEKKKWSYSGPVMERYNATKFGRGQYPGVLTIVSYPNWDAGGTQYYEMNLFFGKPGSTYTLRGWAAVTNYHQVYPAFTEIMTNITLAPNMAAPLSTQNRK